MFVPAGDHVISNKRRLNADNSGLFGPGRIIQSNSKQPILEIEKANDVTVRDVMLTRAEGAKETDKEGILAIDCSDLVIDHVRVIDNQTRSGAIALRRCRNATVSHCLVRNYMRTTIDDRTSSPDWGYAFKATDGTGISVTYSTGTLIEANRVAEERLLPTPELQEKFKLGDFVKRNPKKGNFVSQQVWDLEYVANWQQGSGILVSSPENSRLTRIIGNHIENGAQGIDLHADHVIVANNVVSNCFMGVPLPDTIPLGTNRPINVQFTRSLRWPRCTAKNGGRKISPQAFSAWISGTLLAACRRVRLVRGATGGVRLLPSNPDSRPVDAQTLGSSGIECQQQPVLR